MNAEEKIQQINTLRKRLKTAEEKATEARVRHEQAQADLTQAQDMIEELGHSVDDIDDWITEEAAEIALLLKQAETNLSKAQEAIDAKP